MCQGVTKSGSQCSRKGEPFCYQHKPSATVLPVIPAALVPHSIVKKIETKIKNGPTKSDKAGWIYVFYKQCDRLNTFYKIGRTERSVKKRLKEWPNSILLCNFEVKYNKFAENLIHKYLAHVRAYRYQQDDGSYVSVWADSGEPVYGQTNPGKQSAKRKEIEWFASSWDNLKPFVLEICNYVNTL